MKRCNICGEHRNRKDFNKRLASLDGIHGTCRECMKVYNKELYARSKDKISAQNREYNLKYMYGIDSDEYYRMAVAQDERCAICGIHDERLCVDHCHTTGKVRGLLCQSCNLMLGKAKDSARVLERGAEYLKE